MDSFDACEDFFVLVIEAYVVAVAMKLLGMQVLSDTPSKPCSKQYAPKDDLTWACTDEERKPLLDRITRDIDQVISLYRLQYFPHCILRRHGIPVFITVIDHRVHVLGIPGCHQGRGWNMCLEVLQISAANVY